VVRHNVWRVRDVPAGVRQVDSQQPLLTADTESEVETPDMQVRPALHDGCAREEPEHPGPDIGHRRKRARRQQRARAIRYPVRLDRSGAGDQSQPG
jgi:hypothetical protein